MLRSLPSDIIKNLVDGLIPSPPAQSEVHLYAPYAPGHGPEGACLFGDDYALDTHKRQPWEKPAATRQAAQVSKPRTAAGVTKASSPRGKTRARNALAGLGDDALLTLVANRATSNKDV